MINCSRRLWNNFFLVCSEDDIFHSIPYVELKQVTLSQQQLFVINLVRFLNFNLKNLARFEIFYPKWLITLKICLFYLARCFQSKIKTWNLYLKSQVSAILVKSLAPASSVIFATFYWYFNLSELFPSWEAIRNKFNIILPSFYSSWVKFTHFYEPSYQWRLSRAFLKSFLKSGISIVKWSFELFLISYEKSAL